MLKNERMLKVEDLRKELFLGDYGDQFVDYNQGYICDIIFEIADKNVDSYTSDLLNWVKDNFQVVQEANQEFGVPEDGDILKQIKQGQFYSYEQDLYDNLENIIANWIYNYIQYELHIEEITEEQKEKLFDEIDVSDNNGELEDITEKINEILL